jgi:hypothetical protein
MYCPKWGHEMEITERAYACRRGKMELSINVGRALEDYVRHASATTSAASSSVPWGGEWFCPADGAAMLEVVGGVGCPRCERTIPGTTLHTG